MKKEPTEFVIVSTLRWGSIFKVQKSAQTPASSEWGKLIRRWGKMYLTGPHPPSGTVNPLPENEGNFLDDRFCDFAFRLRAE
jgi:hypothetical protein